MKQPTGPGTVVGANVKLQGVLKDTNDIIIHGHLDGEVGSDQKVVIAEHAQVKGPVTGDSITVAGTVKGSIEAKTKLEILPTGKVQGSIMTKELVIQAGAIFNGKATMPEAKSGEEADEESDNKKSATKSSIEKEPAGKTLHAFWQEQEEKSGSKQDQELEYELE